jgi:ABC-type dipeptide/oligopeptide/nickel transport system ATPase component
MAERDILLEIKDLRTHFATSEGVVRAVDGVDLVVRRGRTLCVLGESGCGKSITARSILQIVDKPGRITGGQILFHDRERGIVDLAAMRPTGPEIRRIRGRKIAMIFQEPMTSLSPVHTIGQQIIEVVNLHLGLDGGAARAHTIDILSRVGIPNAASRLDNYPFQLSGGMRQRAMIALALACKPDLLIADEPTTALDVTTQAQILDLMRDLQAEMGMAMMFITHDLGVVAEIADDVAVMYLGEVVERADVLTLFEDPKHPYTQALLASVP